MKAQFFGASGHFIFSEQYIADWTAITDATVHENVKRTLDNADCMIQ